MTDSKIIYKESFITYLMTDSYWGNSFYVTLSLYDNRLVLEKTFSWFTAKEDLYTKTIYLKDIIAVEVSGFFTFGILRISTSVETFSFTNFYAKKWKALLDKTIKKYLLKNNQDKKKYYKYENVIRLNIE